MTKILQIMIFMKLLLAAKGSKSAKYDRVATEMPRGGDEIELVPLGDKKTFLYTEDYPGNTEYCIMARKHLDMLPGIENTALDAGKEDKVVVKLERLYNDDNPRKWIECVIFYSTQKRFADRVNGANMQEQLKDSDFLGIAIYAQYYKIHGEWRDTLIDNLLELYIKKAILCEPEGFYRKIYHQAENKNLGDETQCSLIESLMEEVLLKFINVLGLPFSIVGFDLKMHAHDDYHTIERWREERSNQIISAENNGPATFKNVVMERPPMPMLNRYDDRDDNRIILLTLIGMIRSGKHTISAVCREWFEEYDDFKRVIDLVNTNKNLTGVSGLDSDIMDLDKMLGDIKEQLRYVEIEFGYSKVCNGRAMDFIKSLDKAEVDVTFYCYDALLASELLNSTKDIHIKSLKIISDSDHILVAQGAMDPIASSSNTNNLELESIEESVGTPSVITYKKRLLADQGEIDLIANSPKVNGLKLNNIKESLETFLINHYKPREDKLKSKLKTLSVYGVGDLNSDFITSDLLNGLEIETLELKIVDEDDMSDLNQLVNKGIITKERFRHLVFVNHRGNYEPRIIELWKRLRKMKLGQKLTILVDFVPKGVKSTDYAQVDNRFYELYLKERQQIQ